MKILKAFFVVFIYNNKNTESILKILKVFLKNMDFHSEDNFLWDQNIISHNLSYNINDELTREMRRMDQDGPHSGAAQRKREHFTGSRKALACYITSDMELNERPHDMSGSTRDPLHLDDQQNNFEKNNIDKNNVDKNEPLSYLDKKSSGLCGIVNNTVTSINKDMTDLFGANWQFIFLVILIAVCIIQYLHYRHATAQLVDLIKLLMVQNYESELVEIPQNIRQDIQELQKPLKVRQLGAQQNTVQQNTAQQNTAQQNTAQQNTTQPNKPAPFAKPETQALVEQINANP